MGLRTALYSDRIFEKNAEEFPHAALELDLYIHSVHRLELVHRRSLRPGDPAHDSLGMLP